MGLVPEPEPSLVEGPTVQQTPRGDPTAKSPGCPGWREHSALPSTILRCKGLAGSPGGRESSCGREGVPARAWPRALGVGQRGACLWLPDPMSRHWSGNGDGPRVPCRFWGGKQWSQGHLRMNFKKNILVGQTVTVSPWRRSSPPPGRTRAAGRPAERSGSGPQTERQKDPSGTPPGEGDHRWGPGEPPCRGPSPAQGLRSPAPLPTAAHAWAPHVSVHTAHMPHARTKATHGHGSGEEAKTHGRS